MQLAAQRANDRHVVIRRPVDAFKITNYAEIVDVNAAACLLRDDMHTITGSRKADWPSLCASMGVWSEQLIVDRADILHTERTRRRQHDEYYVQHWCNIIL